MNSSSGFGAFFSSLSELRYGHVILGLPKTVEFSGPTATILGPQQAHVIAKNAIWAGMQNSIAVNPAVRRLNSNFLSSLQLAVRERFNSIPENVSTDKLNTSQKRLLLEARLMNRLSSQVLFRSDKEGIWKLYYREKYGTLCKIETDEQFENWIKTNQNSILDHYMFETNNEIIELLSKGIAQDFKRISGQADFEFKGQTEAPSVSIIAFDEEPMIKQYYLQQLKNLKKKSKKTENENVETLSEVKAHYIQKGIDEKQVEFIPLCEASIERDILNQADLFVPKAWEPK